MVGNRSKRVMLNELKALESLDCCWVQNLAER